jgi:hypothetical protein
MDPIIGSMKGVSNPSIVKALNEIARQICDEDIAKVDLTCPQNGVSSLIYFFSYNEHTDFYGFSIYCKDCGIYFHYTLGSKPPNFREDLTLLEKQKIRERVAQILNNKRKKLDT